MEQGESRPKTYLFQGDRGCGKTTLARIMAMGLNCEHGDTTEPCMECQSCKDAMAGRAWHITEINMAQLNKKEDAEDIVRNMSYAALTGRNNVYIFDEAQMLTPAAQNLLLKNLEEPPKHTYIIICTTDQQKLLKTLIDRCEKYKFTMPSVPDIKNILNDVYKAEKWSREDLTQIDPAKFVEAMHGRSFREILKSIDQVMRGGMDVLDLVIDGSTPQTIEVCRKVASGDFGGTIALLSQMKQSDEAVDWEGMRLALLGYLRAIVYKTPTRQDAVNSMAHLLVPLYESKDAESRFVVGVFEVCKLMRKQ
jgi:DNA polymerase-3 subunit gamma/tau